jgi:chromosomal replication initiation ATPase DnaA
MLYTEKELLLFREFEGDITEFREFLNKLRYNDIETIKNVICNYFDIDAELMDYQGRKYDIVFVRQIVHWFCYYYTNFSMPKIGYEIGRRDHATVINSRERINNFIDTDKLIANQITELEGIITELGIERKYNRDEKRIGIAINCYDNKGVE